MCGKIRTLSATCSQNLQHCTLWLHVGCDDAPHPPPAHADLHMQTCTAIGAPLLDFRCAHPWFTAGPRGVDRRAAQRWPAAILISGEARSGRSVYLGAHAIRARRAKSLRSMVRFYQPAPIACIVDRACTAVSLLRKLLPTVAREGELASTSGACVMACVYK